MTIQRCSHCRQEKPLEDFGLNRRMKSGRHFLCRICRSLPPRGPIIGTCEECGQEYERSHTGDHPPKFCSVRCGQKASSKRNFPRKIPSLRICGMCDTLYLARDSRNKFCSGKCRGKAASLRKSYGLEVEDYRKLIASGICDACGEPAKGRMTVDHCHETGRVRGWIHCSCNVGIGQAGNNGERLERWRAYLALDRDFREDPYV